MFSNLLSIHTLLQSPKNSLDGLLQLGFQHPGRIFYEGPLASVSYQELHRLTTESAEVMHEGPFAYIKSPHPAYFFASFLKALREGGIPLLLSHKYERSYLSKLVNSIDQSCLVPWSKAGPVVGVFTSGTHGVPKCVFHSLEGLLWNVLGVLERWQQEFKWTDDSTPTFGLVLPWHHFGGFMVLLRAFVLNAKVSHVEIAEEFALNTHVDIASVVPTQITDIIQALQNKTPVTSHYLVGGGASGHLSQAREHGLSLSLSYGLTETGGTVVATSFGEHTHARPYPYRQLQALEDKQFSISGPTVALGYFQNKVWHVFSLAPHGRSLIPPDNGKIDPVDNSLIILGRRDRIIICGGENIDLDEIQSALSATILKRSECLITGLPDKRLGHIAVLFFKPHEADLLSQCQNEIMREFQELPSFKRPRKIIPLPPPHRISGIKPSQEELSQWVRDYETFRFEEWGNPQGQKILGLHGFMGGPQDFSGLALRFPQLHWVVPYLPGHGTAIEKFRHFEDGCCQLFNWWRHLFAPTPFSLVGYSMGGRIGLGLTECILRNKFAHYIKNVLLISTNIGLDDQNQCLERRTQDANLPLHFSTREEKRNFLNTWYSGTLWGNIKTKPIYPSLLEKRLETPDQEWAEAMRLFGQGNHPNFKATLAQLGQSHHGHLCYCFGELDFKYKKYTGTYKEMGFVTKEAVGFGHALLEETPDFLAQVLQSLMGTDS